MYRLLIYSQKLRNTSAEIPQEEWSDLEISKQLHKLEHQGTVVLQVLLISLSIVQRRLSCVQLMSL